MQTIAAIILFILLVFLLISAYSQPNKTTTAAAITNTHPCCLKSYGIQNFSLDSFSTYTELLDSSIQNLRFTLPDVSKPVAIVLPSSVADLQHAVLCARRNSLTIRVRSGGHSYEGLSYTAEHQTPFVVIDLVNLNKVQVDPSSATAWVESGATVGEVYHAVSQSSPTLAFSAGSCSTVGTGGQISGGGFGSLSRKFGLAADNVLDAILIDPNGRILDRDSMGADVFWAIRGGGGGSWGVVYSWKIQLNQVPDRVTMFTPTRSGSIETIAGLVDKWQYVGPTLPDEFYLSLSLNASMNNGNITVSFTGQFLGPKESAVVVMSQTFPELDLNGSDFTEMSWVESAAMNAGLKSVADLVNRDLQPKGSYKAKSDYVQAPILREDLIGIIKYLTSEPNAYVMMDVYGGAMARIGSGDLPFPHRAGNLYCIQYLVGWTKAENGTENSYVDWLRGFYTYMARFVSNNPRAAYVNYLDLDLGTNNWSSNGTRRSIEAVFHGSLWGRPYFLQNYERLVRTKTMFDPDNVFSNAQSIPPLPE